LPLFSPDQAGKVGNIKPSIYKSKIEGKKVKASIPITLEKVNRVEAMEAVVVEVVVPVVIAEYNHL